MGNDPTRRFCRRCGQSLATATIAPTPKVPWYRRLFGGGQAKKAAAAGERPQSMRKDGRTGSGIRPGGIVKAVFQILLIAAVVGAIVGYAIVPSWRDTVNGAISGITQVLMPPADRVNTSGGTTGPGTRNHPAELAWDRTLAYWVVPFAAGEQPTIASSFEPMADITKILVTSGATGDAFKDFARPRDVTLEFLDPAGTVVASKAYELKDDAAAQAFDVGAKGVVGVRLTVRSVFPATEAGAPVALAEIEFFGSQAGTATPTPAP